MKHLIRFAAASAVAAVSLIAGAQPAHAEQVCEATWTRSEYPGGKLCGTWDPGPAYGEIEIDAFDHSDPDGDQEIVLAVQDVHEACEDELSCHFAWTGRSYDLTETENQKIVAERFIPSEITISCNCTPH
jgi:hypothetical protein